MAVAHTEVKNAQDGLNKLRIDIFEDENSRSPIRGYLAMYNPTGYSQEYKNVYDKPSASGNQSVNVFKHIEAPNLTIELLFDATGASISKPSKSSFNNDGAKGSVTDLTEMVRGEDTIKAIAMLLDDMNSISGNTHKPGFMQISWGKLSFRGVLETSKVNHTLFKPDGKPIRSKLSCTFIAHVSLKEQDAETKKNSPDLTRFKRVRGEDRLHLIASDIYKDPQLYLELARVNRLNNFRSLKNGSVLRLPPVKK